LYDGDDEPELSPPPPQPFNKAIDPEIKIKDSFLLTAILLKG